MSHRYTTALSHMILAGTGIYCMVHYHRAQGNYFHAPYVTFGIIIANSLIGVWRWGNPDYGDKVEKLYHHTFFIQSIFALPFIVGQIWLNAGYEKLLAYLHPSLSIIPLSAHIADEDKSNVIDLLMFLNIISCGVVSYQIENHYGVAAAVAFAINQFILQQKNDIFDVPARDIYNYALCFFTYFSFRAVV